MEKQFSGIKVSGFLMIFIQLSFLLGSFLPFCLLSESTLDNNATILAFTTPIALILFAFCFPGYMMIEPNDTRVMMFFGKYCGTSKANGFFWVNPFYGIIKLTERAKNLEIEPIKVNDKAGNPVMIGLVLVWRIKDSYKALFDINSIGSTLNARMHEFEMFVSIQSNSALRSIASEYSYDNNENENDITLRSGSEKIANRLEEEINTRLALAGIEVVEARINYLAYAPEIAAIMLRRQQATAIIAAREKIVEGAVGMVRLALDKLKTENIIDLDDDKKAAMVSNLLVVLCSDEHTQPIINTGTLNH